MVTKHEKEEWLPEHGSVKPVDPLKQLHDLSFRNRFLFELEGVGTCFQCFSRFKVEYVKRWTDNDETAICPCCGIDSVLPGEWKWSTVQEMYDRFFEECQ